MKQKQQKTGFTLIELLVVATIIIILSAIGLVSYSNASESARNSKRKSDIEIVRQALVLYKSDTGSYPVETLYSNMIAELVDEGGYISSPTPLDPKDGDTGCGSNGTSVCRYLYNGTAQQFTLSAPLEGSITPNPYVVTNP